MLIRGINAVFIKYGRKLVRAPSRGYKTTAFLTRNHGNASAQDDRRVLPLPVKAREYGERIALVDQHSAHTYSDLLRRSDALTSRIRDVKRDAAADEEEGEGKVAFLCPNDASYVTAQWGIWSGGDVAVPLSPAHPPGELEYFIQDTSSKVIVTTAIFKERMKPIARKFDIPMITMDENDYLSSDSLHTTTSPTEDILLCGGYKDKPAMIIYTSGTTGRPKGAVHTFGSIQAQTEDMITAWGWAEDDVILHVLPLHHVHGIVNVLMTPLFCGATCVMLPRFDANQVWQSLLGDVEGLDKRINLFMAVPTVYAKLIEEYEKHPEIYEKTEVCKILKSKVRLMVSGSAALPEPIMTKWEEITGHKLLERYGMTEFGMGLTNPLMGERIPGTVGVPFPQVQVCIAKPNPDSKAGYDVIAQGNSQSSTITPGCEEEEGELYVKGPNLFTEYLNKPEATTETFTVDGWFKTGDTACFRNGVYKILGRTSVDIIKSGGYKISALEVERHLLSHPGISEAVVVGLSDVTWGQKVTAVIKLNAGATLDLGDLKAWAKDRMPGYQTPSVLKVVPSIPRNAMGKVNKKELVKSLFSQDVGS